MKTRIFTIMGLLLISILEMAAQGNTTHLLTKKSFYGQNLVFEDQDVNSSGFIIGRNGSITADVKNNLEPIQDNTVKSISPDTIYCVFDREISSFVMYNDSVAYNLIRNNPTTAYLLAEPGIYDVYVYFQNYGTNGDHFFVIREQIPVNGPDTLFFSHTEAVNQIIFQGVDENDVPFVESNGGTSLNLGILCPDSLAVKFLGRSFNRNSNIFFSNFSENYIITASQAFKNPERDKFYHAVFEPVNGLVQTLILTNSFQDYVAQDLEFRLPDTLEQFEYAFRSGDKFLDPVGEWTLLAGGSGDQQDGNVLEAKLFLTDDYMTNYGKLCFFIFYSSNNQMLLASEAFRVDQDSVINSNFYNAPNFVKSSDGGKMHIGNGPVTLHQYADNFTTPNYNVVRFILPPNPRGMYNQYYYPQCQDLYYRICNADWQLLDEGELYDFYYYTTTEEECYFEINSKSFTVAEKQSQINHLTYFNFSTEDAIPPNISSLQIKNPAALPQEYVHMDEAYKISFAGRDYFMEESGYYFINHYKRISPDSTRLYIKKEGTSNWQELSVNNKYEDEDIGIYFESEELIFTEDELGYYDVKIHVVDSVGNSTTLTVEPAFKVVDFYVDVEEHPASAKSIDLKCYPNPFSDKIQIEYVIEKAQDVELKICNLQGQTIHTLYNGSQNKGRHQLQLNVPEEIVPGVYYLIMKTEGTINTRKIVKL